MPDFQVNVSYTVTFTKKEFRVLMAALRHAGDGAAFREEWRQDAASLQAELFRMRNQIVAQSLGEVAKARANEE